MWLVGLMPTWAPVMPRITQRPIQTSNARHVGSTQASLQAGGLHGLSPRYADREQKQEGNDTSNAHGRGRVWGAISATRTAVPG